MKSMVANFRVSTREQGRSGLGFEPLASLSPRPPNSRAASRQ